MFSRLLSISFLAFFALSSAILYPMAVVIWLCTIAFDRRLVLLHLFTSFWGSLYLWTMPAWSVSIEGRHRIRKGVTYVVVSNHQSSVDILVAFRLFFPFKWVSKAEMFKVPFIGWNLVLNRYIKLKRSDRKGIRKMLEDCEKTLARGSSVYLFPEGTRSETGEVKRFKPGAFALAKKMKVPILPIAIIGSKDALPKHSLTIRGKHHIKVKVLEEIPHDHFAEMPVDELSERVRRRIADEVHASSDAQT
ncbi:MAG: lysophospholipid acyltransferase family protein [Rhodothermales bacterium]